MRLNGKQGGWLDIIAVLSQVVAIVGGLVAAIFVIVEWNDSTKQRAQELRWQQANLAKELVDDMLDDEGYDALLMLDWGAQGREFAIKEGQNEIIKSDDIYVALRTDRGDFSEKEIYIRDRFDRLFFLVNQLQWSADIGLIKPEDVTFPLSEYTELMCSRKEVFENYMNTYSAPRTLKFFEGLDAWRSCTSANNPTN